METNLSSGAPRDKWHRKMDFLMAVIGFSVALSNFMRFPTLVYKNGGAAFFIPYLLALFVSAAPLFLMELALGQYHKRGAITIWEKIMPFCKGIGYCFILISFYVGTYYNVMIAWGVHYLYGSFSDPLPWTHCNNSWNTPVCLARSTKSNIQIGRSINSSTKRPTPGEEYFRRHVYELHKSTGLDDLGSIKWELVMCLLVVYIITYFSLWRGVTVLGRVIWVTVLFPYFVLIILLIRGLTLPEAFFGIRYYLTPDFSVLKMPNVWINAGSQVFFSLGPGYGTLAALASYNKFKNDIYCDAMICSSLNSATSFIAGFVVFSVLGQEAKRTNVELKDIAEEGLALAFMVFPEVLSTFANSNFWSVMFFLMIIILGLGSSIGGTESIITGLSDEFNIVHNNRKIFLLILHVLLFLVGVVCCTQGGMYFLTLLDAYTANYSLLYVCLFETICVSYIYGKYDFKDDINDMIGYDINIWWTLCWAVLSPIYIGFLLISSLVSYEPLTFGSYTYPQWANHLGILLTLSSVMLIPIFALLRMYNTLGDYTEKFKVIKRADRLLAKQRDKELEAAAKLKSPETESPDSEEQKQKRQDSAHTDSPQGLPSPQSLPSSVSSTGSTLKTKVLSAGQSGLTSPVGIDTESPALGEPSSPTSPSKASPSKTANEKEKILGLAQNDPAPRLPSPNVSPSLVSSTRKTKALSAGQTGITSPIGGDNESLVLGEPLSPASPSLTSPSKTGFGKHKKQGQPRSHSTSPPVQGNPTSILRPSRSCLKRPGAFVGGAAVPVQAYLPASISPTSPIPGEQSSPASSGMPSSSKTANEKQRIQGLTQNDPAPLLPSPNVSPSLVSSTRKTKALTAGQSGITSPVGGDIESPALVEPPSPASPGMLSPSKTAIGKQHSQGLPPSQSVSPAHGNPVSNLRPSKSSLKKPSVFGGGAAAPVQGYSLAPTSSKKSRTSIKSKRSELLSDQEPLQVKESPGRNKQLSKHKDVPQLLEN